MLDALLARAPDGIVTRAQLLAAGAHERSVPRLCASGTLQELLPRVYRVTAHPETDRQKLLATLAWAGEGAALCLETAAAVWGMPSFRVVPVHVGVPGRAKLPSSVPFELILHVDRRYAPDEITTRHGLRVTRGARTVLDLATVLEGEAFEGAVDEALRVRATSAWHLRRLVERGARQGRAGMKRLRELVRRRGPTLVRMESPLEVPFLKLFRALGLPLPTAQYEILDGTRPVFRADFAWPEQRVIAEIESYQHHSSRAAWAKDVAKLNELAAGRWVVLRLTKEHLGRPEEVDALVREALRLPKRRARR